MIESANKLQEMQWRIVAQLIGALHALLLSRT